MEINKAFMIYFRFGKEAETESKVAHNERLEFLGDAVVEFITSVHLFHMFPDLEEGGLGMISHKKSLITIFGHKHFRPKFQQKFDIFQ